MKKKIFLIISILLILGIGIFVNIQNNSNFKKVEISEFSIVDVAHLDEELDTWVKDNSKNKGVKQKQYQNKTYALISAGTVGADTTIIVDEVLKNDKRYKVNYIINEDEDKEYSENKFVLIEFKTDLKLSK